MTLGEVLLTSLTSGVITQDEMDWVAVHQDNFSRAEVASALRLGRLIDSGTVNLGCRLPSVPGVLHASHLDWIETLGRQGHGLESRYPRLAAG